MNYTTTAGADYIKCPFFQGHDDKRIACEPITDCKLCFQVFRNKTKRVEYEQTFCENHYGMCTYYNSVMHWNWPDDNE